MRCKEFIQRNGFWTGKRCSREATKRVVFDGSEDVRICCTQHANKLARYPGAHVESLRDGSQENLP